MMIKSAAEAKTPEEMQEWLERQAWAAQASPGTMYGLYRSLGRAHVFAGGKLQKIEIEYLGDSFPGQEKILKAIWEVQQ